MNFWGCLAGLQKVRRH